MMIFAPVARSMISKSRLGDPWWPGFKVGELPDAGCLLKALSKREFECSLPTKQATKCQECRSPHRLRRERGERPP
jgi:hypothetical protein